jgi:GNAT superfamily N-acetyltransferase
MCNRFCSPLAEFANLPKSSASFPRLSICKSGCTKEVFMHLNADFAPCATLHGGEAEALYYILVPTKPRPVPHDIEFMTIQEFLEDEELASGLWDLVASQFKTRRKFLTIWQDVRYLAVYRHEGTLGAFLLVSAPLNWQIDYVTVRADLRRQGIAASLVNSAVNRAWERGVPYLMLTSKPSLRPLYEGQCGFQVVGTNASAVEAALVTH